MLPEMRKVLKPLILTMIGGFTYSLIEILYRGYTHWTMFFIGGISFYIIGCINEKTDVSIFRQMLYGSAIITILEFCAGIVINRILGWNIWDYSNLPFNIAGQICPLFSIIWFIISFIAIIFDDYCRYWIFKEEKPKYRFW